LTEFGFFSFIIIIYFFLLLVKKIYFGINVIPKFLIAGFLGILVNTLFSGAMVYPASQFLIVWYLAFILSFNENKVVYANKFFSYIAFLIVIVIIFTNARNIMCLNCMSVGSRQAPSFWNYGQSVNLVPYDEKKINVNIKETDY